MRFLLRDDNPAVVAAWRDEFAGAADVSISHGDIFDQPADAIVSPANSFGFMDGGMTSPTVSASAGRSRRGFARGCGRSMTASSRWARRS